MPVHVISRPTRSAHSLDKNNLETKNTFEAQRVLNFFLIGTIGPVCTDAFKCFRKIATMVIFAVMTGAKLTHVAVSGLVLCSVPSPRFLGNGLR